MAVAVTVAVLNLTLFYTPKNHAPPSCTSLSWTKFEAVSENPFPTPSLMGLLLLTSIIMYITRTFQMTDL